MLSIEEADVSREGERAGKLALSLGESKWQSPVYSVTPPWKYGSQRSHILWENGWDNDDSGEILAGEVGVSSGKREGTVYVTEFGRK